MYYKLNEYKLGTNQTEKKKFQKVAYDNFDKKLSGHQMVSKKVNTPKKPPFIAENTICSTYYHSIIHLIIILKLSKFDKILPIPKQ